MYRLRDIETLAHFHIAFHFQQPKAHVSLNKSFLKRLLLANFPCTLILNALNALSLRCFLCMGVRVLSMCTPFQCQVKEISHLPSSPLMTRPFARISMSSPLPLTFILTVLLCCSHIIPSPSPSPYPHANLSPYPHANLSPYPHLCWSSSWRCIPGHGHRRDGYDDHTMIHIYTCLQYVHIGWTLTSNGSPGDFFVLVSIYI